MSYVTLGTSSIVFPSLSTTYVQKVRLLPYHPPTLVKSVFIVVLISHFFQYLTSFFLFFKSYRFTSPPSPSNQICKGNPRPNSFGNLRLNQKQKIGHASVSTHHPISLNKKIFLSTVLLLLIFISLLPVNLTTLLGSTLYDSQIKFRNRHPSTLVYTLSKNFVKTTGEPYHYFPFIINSYCNYKDGTLRSVYLPLRSVIQVTTYLSSFIYK